MKMNVPQLESPWTDWNQSQFFQTQDLFSEKLECRQVKSTLFSSEIFCDTGDMSTRERRVREWIQNTLGEQVGLDSTKIPEIFRIYDPLIHMRNVWNLIGYCSWEMHHCKLCYMIARCYVS